jgi:hypothetical protein
VQLKVTGRASHAGAAIDTGPDHERRPRSAVEPLANGVDQCGIRMQQAADGPFANRFTRSGGSNKNVHWQILSRLIRKHSVRMLRRRKSS